MTLIKRITKLHVEPVHPKVDQPSLAFLQAVVSAVATGSPPATLAVVALKDTLVLQPSAAPHAFAIQLTFFLRLASVGLRGTVQAQFDEQDADFRHALTRLILRMATPEVWRAFLEASILRCRYLSTALRPVDGTLLCVFKTDLFAPTKMDWHLTVGADGAMCHVKVCAGETAKPGEAHQYYWTIRTCEVVHLSVAQVQALREVLVQGRREVMDREQAAIDALMSTVQAHRAVMEPMERDMEVLEKDFYWCK